MAKVTLTRSTATGKSVMANASGTLKRLTLELGGNDAALHAPADGQAHLARAARLATMGELTALIAHEVSQPLMAIVTNADTCLSWLANSNPNLDGARQAAERVVRNGHRAGSIVKSICALARKSEPEMAQFDINDAKSILKDGCVARCQVSAGRARLEL